MLTFGDKEDKESSFFMSSVLFQFLFCYHEHVLLIC